MAFGYAKQQQRLSPNTHRNPSITMESMIESALARIKVMVSCGEHEKASLKFQSASMVYGSSEMQPRPPQRNGGYR